MPLYYRGVPCVRHSFQIFNYSCGYTNNKLCITHFKITQTCLIVMCVYIYIYISTIIYDIVTRRARFREAWRPRDQYHNNNIIIIILCPPRRVYRLCLLTLLLLIKMTNAAFLYGIKLYILCVQSDSILSRPAIPFFLRKRAC